MKRGITSGYEFELPTVNVAAANTENFYPKPYRILRGAKALKKHYCSDDLFWWLCWVILGLWSCKSSILAKLTGGIDTCKILFIWKGPQKNF